MTQEELNQIQNQGVYRVAGLELILAQVLTVMFARVEPEKVKEIFTDLQIEIERKFDRMNPDMQRVIADQAERIFSAAQVSASGFYKPPTDESENPSAS